MLQENLLIQNTTDGIFMLDKDGYILSCNPAAVTITGYSNDELLSKSISIFYLIENDITKSEYELSLAHTKGKFITEDWKTRKDKTKFWAEQTLFCLLDEEKNFKGYGCILRDISEKKQSELALRKSEQRYRLMVEGVQDYSIFMLDPHGNIVTWNDGAHRIKGYNASEIIGKHFSIFYTREDLEIEKPANELRIAISAGKYEEEAWRVKKNGSLFWANVVITSLFDETNKLVGFSKVTRDLTDRKKNEEMLRQSEERYRLLVEQVTDYGIFMMDEKGRIISWNEGAKKIKGYTADEIIGKYFSIFYPEEEILNGKPAHELKVAIAEGKYEEEGWRIKKDGSRFWANIVITSVYNHDRVHIGFSKVTRDLTERKASERALRDSHDRYRKLSDELRATNKDLTYANEELEQFTSIVSHDLQEPVRTIKSFLQMIDMKLDSAQTDDLKTYISKAINSANRMKELILNVLHYSQLGKDEIVKEEVNVSDLINEALQNLKGSIEKRNAKITLDIDVETVYGDHVQLVQLVQNILSNAVKFTSNKSPEINIQCKREHGQIKFSVSDNGIGISQDNVGKVFEIFRRLNNGKEYPGTGIGLAICKKIVDRHHGRIWPESQFGQGTTFHFTLSQDVPEMQIA